MIIIRLQNYIFFFKIRLCFGVSGSYSDTLIACTDTITFYTDTLTSYIGIFVVYIRIFITYNGVFVACTRTLVAHTRIFVAYNLFNNNPNRNHNLVFPHKQLYSKQ